MASIQKDNDEDHLKQLRETTRRLRSEAYDESAPLENRVALRDSLLSAIRKLREASAKFEEREILEESRRVAEVQRRHEEEHPPATEECIICLESMRIINGPHVDHVVVLCCGKFVHTKCISDWFDRMHVTCPHCRFDDLQEILMNDVRSTNNNEELMILAERGVSHAQTIVGVRCQQRQDMLEAKQWFQRAAENGCPLGNFHLGAMYSDGVPGVINQDLAAVRRHYETSADLGNHLVHFLLAGMYKNGQGGEEDKEEAARYFSLALLADDSELKRDAQRAMFEQFLNGEGGLKESPLLAKYYLQKHLSGLLTEHSDEHDGILFSGLECYKVVQLFHRLSDALETGDCSTYAPQIFHWAKRAASKLDEAESNKITTHMIDPLRRELQSYCAHCKKPANYAGRTDSLMRCGRCNVVRYCNKECQTEHWRCIHKKHCLKLD